MIQSLNVYPKKLAPAVVLLLLLCSKIIITNFCFHLSVCICSQTVVLISEGAKGSSDRVNYQFPLHQLFNNEMTQNHSHPLPRFIVDHTHTHLRALFLFHFCNQNSKMLFHSKRGKCHFGTHSNPSK